MRWLNNLLQLQLVDENAKPSTALKDKAASKTSEEEVKDEYE